MFSLNLIFGVSFVSLTLKVAELLWRSLFTFWMTHETRDFSDGCLSVPSSFLIFLTERLYFWLNLTFNNHFFIVQYTERTGHAYFSQNCFDYKKASSKSDRHHIPVQRSATISGLSVIILLYLKSSDDFHCVKTGLIRSFSGPYFTPRIECRDTEYLFSFSLNVWMQENMDQKNSEYGHLRSVSAGSEPVNIWVPLRDIHTKPRAIATITIFRAIISIVFITTLESVGCYKKAAALKGGGSR